MFRRTPIYEVAQSVGFSNKTYFYDKYGNLIPSLAEDWSVSQDGLTYTYKLRKGVKWYTSEGEEYAEVKAQDFVTGLKHAADGKSDGLTLQELSRAPYEALLRLRPSGL